MTERPPRSSAKRRWRPGPIAIALLIAGGLLGLLAAFAVLDMLRISRDLEAARTLITQASAQIEQGELGPARANLAEAGKRLSSANSRLYNRPQYELLSWLPVVHQNLDALRDGVGQGLVMVNGGTRILEVTRPLENDAGRLDIPLVTGQIPIDAVSAALVEVQALAGRLPDVSEKPDSPLLLPPVRRLADTVYGEASGRRGQLFGVARGLELLHDVAGGNGDRRYLLAIANTAEMRGAGGMILSYGVLEMNGGVISLGEFGEIAELPVATAIDPEAAGIPPDFMRRWSALNPTSDWRNVTVGPDLQLVAPAMVSMYQEATGQSLDGIIQIDPAGLAAVLQGTGPVEVPDVGLVTAENVVDLTLNRAYVDFPDRDQRKEVLANVTEEVFRALVAGQFASLRPLGDALFAAAQERHVIMLTESVAAARQLRFFGADGVMPTANSEYLLLTVQNQSGNKLDYYLDTTVELVGERFAGIDGTAKATITIANTATAGQTVPEYVYGPAEEVNGQIDQPGLYNGFVSLYLPPGTALTGSGGDAVTGLDADTEAGRRVVSFPVSIPAGTTLRVTLDLVLPPRSPFPYSLAIVPVPRVRPTVYRVDFATSATTRAAIDQAVTRPVVVTDGSAA